MHSLNWTSCSDTVLVTAINEIGPSVRASLTVRTLTMGRDEGKFPYMVSSITMTTDIDVLVFVNNSRDSELHTGANHFHASPPYSGRWFGLGGNSNDPHKNFISLQTCFPNFQLNQKSRGATAPSPIASYAYAGKLQSIC